MAESGGGSSSIASQIISIIEGGITSGKSTTEMMNEIAALLGSSGISAGSITEIISGVISGDGEEEVKKKLDKASSSGGIGTPGDSYPEYVHSKIPTSISKHPVFTLNGKDYSKFVIVGTYRVNSHDIYEEKTNANKQFLRRKIRNRINGAFTMLFTTPEEYSEFVSNWWNSQGNSGESRVGIWVNNMLTFKETTVYLSFEGVNDIPFLGIKKTDGLEVTIEEQ